MPQLQVYRSIFELVSRNLPAPLICIIDLINDERFIDCIDLFDFEDILNLFCYLIKFQTILDFPYFHKKVFALLKLARVAEQLLFRIVDVV